jgi:hypothetical protein
MIFYIFLATADVKGLIFLSPLNYSKTKILATRWCGKNVLPKSDSERKIP